MVSTPSIDLQPIARKLGLPLANVEQTLALLDDGNTLAFVTRFRKDLTGGLDEHQISRLQREVNRARQFAERKTAIFRSLDSQGQLTDDLRRQLDSASSVSQLEDYYLPFKTKRQTLASVARERGLTPLADEILEAAPAAGHLPTRAADFVAEDNELPDVTAVLAGIRHLIAERFSERADLRERLRPILDRGQLVSTKAEALENASTEAFASASALCGEHAGSKTFHPEGSNTAGARSLEKETDRTSLNASREPKLSVRQRRRRKLEDALRNYFDFRELLSKVRPHRVLAINRGERAKILRVRVEADQAAIRAAAADLLIPPQHPHAVFLDECLRDALQRLVIPSLERDIRRELTERAEEHAVGVFAKNLRKLLLQPPVRNCRVLAIDPGFKSGCQLVALDEFGNVLDHGAAHLVGSDDNRQAARRKIADLVTAHDLSVIAIGNGTACRETELLVADIIQDELEGREVKFVVVNEAGASVYSTSAIGREELPKYDAIFRGAISIGRRLLDPLSELVKIHPSHVGVGMYQHDMKAKHLRESLEAIVESCVNYVGVDVNTASPSLLQHVSGLNQLTARRIYEYRLEHGPFQTREQLKEVPGVGAATFVQAAGFLHITGGDNPLDATWIHPESYAVAEKVLDSLGISSTELQSTWQCDGGNSGAGADSNRSQSAVWTKPIWQRLREVEPTSLTAELGIGELTLQDILNGLAAPGRDPREDLPPPVFRSDIVKIDDLAPGMELTGTVLNVVDFGVFVDIGIVENALVHISRLADRYIGDTHDVVSIGDVLNVWVTEVDKERRRVSLTAIPPGKSPGGRRPPRKRRQVNQKRQPARNRSAKDRKAASGRTVSRKPAPPITQEMVQGREPMRSFSDLLQFYQAQSRDNNKRAKD